MASLLLGVVALVVILWSLRAISRMNPQVAVSVLRVGGGLTVLTVAGFLALRGRVDIAIAVGTIGLGLLGGLHWMPSLGARIRKAPAQVSRVRSAFVEMELDHDSGAMNGRILAGPHEGATLDDLDIGMIAGFLVGVDEESRALLVAYLDRRAPSWREDMQDGATMGEGRASWSSGKMTEQEAYQILGLQAGASAADIGRAHRSLMKKLHPDQGGSTYLAARVNEAKEVLLRRHR